MRARSRRSSSNGETTHGAEPEQFLPVPDEGIEDEEFVRRARDGRFRELRLRSTIAAIDRRKFNESTRSVEVSFSSERNIRGVVLPHRRGVASVAPLRDVGSVLLNHDPDQIVGRPENTRIDFDEKVGRATIVFDEDEVGERAMRKVKSGSLRGVSVGFRIHDYKYIDRDEEFMGFSGPAIVAKRWSALEFSLTPIPADESVGVGRSSEDDMAKKKTGEETSSASGAEPNVTNDATRSEPAAPAAPAATSATTANASTAPAADPAPRSAPSPAAPAAGQEGLRAELDRQAQIRDMAALAARAGHEWAFRLAAELCGDKGATVEVARKRFFDELEKQRPPMPAPIRIDLDERDKKRSYYRDCILTRIGNRNACPDAEKQWGRMERMSFASLARRCLEDVRVETRFMSDNEVLRTALQRSSVSHTPSDFPLILADAANKVLLMAYTEANEGWRPWVRVVPASDFKDLKRYRFSEAPDLDVNPAGFPHREATFSEEKESYAVAKYSKKFSVAMEVLRNDDMGAFDRVPAMFGAAAARKIADLVFGVLTSNPNMSDGVALFHANHGNLQAADATLGKLDVTTLGNARKAMRTQKGIGATAFVGVMPRYLIVPEALAPTAEQLIASMVDPTKSNATPNLQFIRNLSPIANPRLDANDVNAWYLAADPNTIDTAEVAFLDGNETPSIQSEVPFDVEGLVIKVLITAAAKAIDWRGFYKNAGTS